MGSAIKVMIVDDSLFFREMLSAKLASYSNLEVVATAADPYDAVEKIKMYKPDVLTCDIEMPKMNGIEFIRQLMPQYPIPVVVVSSVSNVVFKALNAGAVDFIAKPKAGNKEELDLFANELVGKIRIASIAKVPYNNEELVLEKEHVEGIANSNIDLIAIGASTGGTEAIRQILKELPKDMPGIVIVQHIPPVFSKMFADGLNETTGFKVKEAEDRDIIKPGHVYIAPGDFHMRVTRLGSVYRVNCVKEDKVNNHRPSVDVLFESVAKICKGNAIGVILTGMGKDGAKGLLSMKKNGNFTIGQDEESCVVYGMPKAAYDIGAVVKRVPLNKVALTIVSALSGKM